MIFSGIQICSLIIISYLKQRNIYMNRIRILRDLLVITGLLVSAASSAGSGLAGHYSVGPQTGTDFPDLQSALLQVEIEGISDHVELILTPGIHPTHVEINPITLTGNPDARLMIISEDLNDRAVLTHTPVSSADNWIIKINQAEMIDLVSLDFEVGGNLDLTAAVVFDQGGTDINIIDNIFTAHPVAVSSQQDDVSLISQFNDTFISELQVRENEFYFGGAAIFLQSSEVDGLQDLTVSDNLMTGQTARGSVYLMYLKRVRNLTIEKNTAWLSSQHANGPLLSSANDLLFNRNSILMDGGGQSHGLRLLSNNLGTGSLSIISNNFIQATQYGIQLTGQNAGVSLFNNSILLTGTLLGTGFYTSPVDSNNIQVSAVAMKGNIMINLSDAGDTRVLNVSNSNMFTEVDHNIMYDVDGGSYVLDNTVYSTFAEYQNATGFDGGSSFRDISFVDASSGDLHLTPDLFDDTSLLIPANTQVIRDFDGALRATNLHRPGADDAPLPDLIYYSGFELVN